MKELFIVTALTLFVLSEARPGVVTQKPIEPEKSVETGDSHVRVRRQNFDYVDYMEKFWNKVDSCTDCNSLNVGNGYKNWNTVHMGRGRGRGRGRGQQSRARHSQRNYDMLNIGNGSKNTNTVTFGREYDSGNQGTVNIGNGSRNRNTVFFGAGPGPRNKDPFRGPFWDD